MGNFADVTSRSQFPRAVAHWSSDLIILLSKTCPEENMSTETERQAAVSRPHKQSRLCSLPHKEIQQVQSSRASWQRQGSSPLGKHIKPFSPPCVSDVFSACSSAAPSCSSFCRLLFHPRGNTSFLRLFFCSVFIF